MDFVRKHQKIIVGVILLIALIWYYQTHYRRATSKPKIEPFVQFIPVFGEQQTHLMIKEGYNELLAIDDTRPKEGGKEGEVEPIPKEELLAAYGHKDAMITERLNILRDYVYDSRDFPSCGSNSEETTSSVSINLRRHIGVISHSINNIAALLQVIEDCLTTDMRTQNIFWIRDRKKPVYLGNQLTNLKEGTEVVKGGFMHMFREHTAILEEKTEDGEVIETEVRRTPIQKQNYTGEMESITLDDLITNIILMHKPVAGTETITYVTDDQGESTGQVLYQTSEIASIIHYFTGVDILDTATKIIIKQYNDDPDAEEEYTMVPQIVDWTTKPIVTINFAETYIDNTAPIEDNENSENSLTPPQETTFSLKSALREIRNQVRKIDEVIRQPLVRRKLKRLVECKLGTFDCQTCQAIPAEPAQEEAKNTSE